MVDASRVRRERVALDEVTCFFKRAGAAEDDRWAHYAEMSRMSTRRKLRGGTGGRRGGPKG